MKDVSRLLKLLSFLLELEVLPKDVLHSIFVPCSSLCSLSLHAFYCLSLSLTLQLPSATHCVSKLIFQVGLLTNPSLFSSVDLPILLNMALSEIPACSSNSDSKLLSTENLVLKYW